MQVRARPAAAVVALLLVSVFGSGCASTVAGGTITIDSQNAEPLRLQTSFAYGGYGVSDSDSSLILSTVPLTALESGGFETAQIIHVQLMWWPQAGKTPVNAEATNIIIRYVVLVGTEAGIYGGGGFAWPTGTPGKTGLGLEVTGSSLSLLAATAGFRDRLSPAELRGDVGGPLDQTVMTRFRNAVSQIVTDRLGRTMWIRAIDPHDASDSMIRADGLAGAGHSPG